MTTSLSQAMRKRKDEGAAESLFLKNVLQVLTAYGYCLFHEG